MEKNILKSSTDNQAEKETLCTSSDESSSNGNVSKAPPKKKEVNSWDCSTPTNNEKTSKKKNDWDSSSECQETMVEPFDNNENPKDCDNWDSESEKNSPKAKGPEVKVTQPFLASSLDSYDISIADLSDLEKSSILELIGSERGMNGDKAHEEDLLLVEDIEEFLRDDNSPKMAKQLLEIKTQETPKSLGSNGLSTDSEKVRSNRSEGTREDTTIWMIPKSERTQSGESTNKLISSSDREKIEKLNMLKSFLKKTKSLSDVQKSKIRRRKARSSRSDYLDYQKNYKENFLLAEGSNLHGKLEIESTKTKDKISDRENFDRSSVFFTEYECRAVTVEKDVPEKQSIGSESVVQSSDTLPAAADTGSGTIPSNNHEDRNADRPAQVASGEIAGTRSSDTVLDVVSLPDMTGRNSMQERQKDPHAMPNSENERLEKSKSKTQSSEDNRMSESWFLLDSTGHYQPVTRNEVSILLNGRSADAVLQGRKEHLISKATLRDTKSLKDSLSCMQTKDSFQHFLKEEDTGGEDEGRKSIDLERKVENTLFYIQPNMNFTASIRIIPVDSEMIHIWRTTRDNGSLISSEVDLSYPSQDSVETNSQRNTDLHSSAVRRSVEQTLSEQDENQILETTTEDQETDHGFRHSRTGVDYSRLLMETRTIVDSLSDNFKSIQRRLDGETTRSVALQGEVNDLKLFLKTFEGKFPQKNSREILSDPPLSTGPNSSIPSIKDRSDLRSKSIIEECEETPSCHNLEMQKDSQNSRVLKRRHQNPDDMGPTDWTEESDIITVNIYTLETPPPSTPFGQTQETYSLVQSNLTMIENKMKRLQQENDIVMKQNMNLKRKLREISLELEKYLAGTSQQDVSFDENRELDKLRDQVCNLKLELENLKNSARMREEELMQENSLMQQEFAKIIFSLKDWCVMAGEVYEKIEIAKNGLEQNGITIEVNLDAETIQNPKNFSNLLSCYVEKTARHLLAIKEENNFYEQTLNENLQKEVNSSKEISGLDQVISGYAELIDQCRKGQMTSGDESKVMEDYFAVIMEKASLMEEIKILKAENEMLLESQMEHYEKLKQTMIALKDRKSEIINLETSQKLSDDEKSRMADMLKLYEQEKQKMEMEISKKSQNVEDLIGEMERKESEIRDCNERLKAAVDEIKNLEKSARLKDEMINEIKMENEDLLNSERMKNNQIKVLEEDVKNLEIRGTQLEAELTSTKLFLKESQKEMTEYISHLEALVSNSQESIDKTKQKLKESHQTITRLKTENDALDKQHQCDLKLFNSTKDELDSHKERLIKANDRLKETEEEREELVKKLETLAEGEKEKSEALELLAREYKTLSSENADLKGKVDIYSKDREESLKEQKDLINKYAMLSKEVQKLQEKYRTVKNECNQRTDLIKYLEMMLKENLIEYNNRTACLEQNISRIIEKIVACKKGMRDKHSGVDAEIKELRRQLEVTYREREELENVVDNYYTLMKHLEGEIQEREKKVDELHAKLSLEQQKTVKCDDERRSCQDLLEAPSSSEIFRIEQLESQLAVAETELAECKSELHHCHTNHDNEKKKLELDGLEKHNLILNEQTIADLKSEMKRYQLRIEVMMRNLANSNKAWNGVSTDKRSADDSDIQTLKKELEEKNKLITELNDAVNNHKAEIKLKESDLENCKKKCFYLDEELKNLQNQISNMQGAISATNKTSEMQQREKDEMAEKLLQSIKLIMEERSTRQTIESVAMEKEKSYKIQIDHIKNELLLKTKECDTLSGEVVDKKKLMLKLQADLKKMKLELASLKGQVSIYKRKNACRGDEDNGIGEEEVLCTSGFHSQKRTQSVSTERLESCLRELKEVRDLNLQLRKTEGQYQAKIVRLEDEIRDARLLIKELQGDIKTEKKSKKSFRNMILAAKKEVEKCLLAKQLMSVVADRINRHLDLSEIPSRELLSGFRLSESSNSSKICT